MTMTSLNMSSNYACACLNVFIRPHHPPSSSSPAPTLTDPDYRTVYVGQEGISIVPTLTFSLFHYFNKFSSRFIPN